MQPTSFDTYVITVIGTTNPTVIAKAGNIPMRVLARNVGGTLIFISQSISDVTGPDAPTTSVYRLPTAFADVFIIAPRQSLYAIGAGPGAIVSVSISEAIPVI